MQVKACQRKVCDEYFGHIHRREIIMPRSRHRIPLVVAVACGLAWAYALPQAQGGVPLGIGADADGMPSLAPLLKKVTPAVVSIAVKGRIGEEQNPLLKD